MPFNTSALTLLENSHIGQFSTCVRPGKVFETQSRLYSPFVWLGKVMAMGAQCLFVGAVELSLTLCM